MSAAQRIVAAAVAGMMAIGVAAAAPPPAPKLIVAISVDQYSALLQDRYRTTYRKGLARLSRGIAFTGYQSHAATETCPGHSTILTGRHPAATGIVANTWYDRASGKNVYCVAVPNAPADARGPQNLKVDTFGDWLKASVPGARVFSISGKDRAAIMMGGHHPDGVWWWKDGIGFATSAYAGPATPAITAPAEAFNTARLDAWRAAPPTLWPDPAGRCRALQRPHRFGDLDVSGKVPPEQALAATKGDFPGTKLFQEQLHSSPLYDRLVLDFAAETIDRERLGHGPAIDLLALSLSATDYVGHRFGSGGAEMCVQLGALDQALGRFLNRLDRLHVSYIVALTADHGGTDAAERLVETRPDARRIDGHGMIVALNAALRQKFALSSNPIVSDDPQELTFGALPAAIRPRIRDAAIAWLHDRPDVAEVLTADQVAAAIPPPGKPVTDLSFAERFHESFDRARSGDIMVAYRPHASFYHPEKPGDYIAGHGSPWDDDRRVPILFWWRGVRPDMPAYPAETVDIAPTLAAIAGMRAPEVDGHCLRQVTETCPK